VLHDSFASYDVDRELRDDSRRVQLDESPEKPAGRADPDLAHRVLDAIAWPLVIDPRRRSSAKALLPVGYDHAFHCHSPPAFGENVLVIR
jgi:hypothetical protein